MTPTGRQAALPLLQKLQGRIVQRYLPYDLPGAVRRFLREVRPAAGILMETEIWPNLQERAHRTGVAVVLANARLSERSLRRALRWDSLMRPAASRLAAVAAQTQADKDRWTRLYDGPISVTGNLKFDAAPAPEQIDAGRKWRRRLGERPLWVFASTREGEERLLVDAILRRAALPASAGSLGDPAPVLLFVPRHPQRFDEVQALLQAAGWQVARRSAWGDDGPRQGVPAQLQSEEPLHTVWLGDSLGEMALYYGLSDAALLGGSFAALGGQNLIEAAACGCPVLMGPHTFNFAEAAQLAKDAGAAVRCTDVLQAVRTACAWAVEPIERTNRAKLAREFARAHRGATERTVDALQVYLA